MSIFLHNSSSIDIEKECGTDCMERDIEVQHNLSLEGAVYKIFDSINAREFSVILMVEVYQTDGSKEGDLVGFLIIEQLLSLFLNRSAG